MANFEADPDMQSGAPWTWSSLASDRSMYLGELIPSPALPAARARPASLGLGRHIGYFEQKPSS